MLAICMDVHRFWVSYFTILPLGTGGGLLSLIVAFPEDLVHFSRIYSSTRKPYSAVNSSWNNWARFRH